MIDTILAKILDKTITVAPFSRTFHLISLKDRKPRSLIERLNESRSLINQAPNVRSFQGLCKTEVKGTQTPNIPSIFREREAAKNLSYSKSDDFKKLSVLAQILSL